MYEWFKAFHVISVIAWMAGLLYLPRLFVYHSDCEVGSSSSEIFKIMERRLLSMIMTPAMIGSWVLGLGMILVAGISLISEGLWFWTKLSLVVGLSGFHFYLAGLVRSFEDDRNVHARKFYRLINEIPTGLMVVIVIMVVVKPF